MYITFIVLENGRIREEDEVAAEWLCHATGRTGYHRVNRSQFDERL